jgi:hypothetical protein
MTYTFNVTTPPLLKDFAGEIVRMPAEAITQVQGIAQWEEDTSLDIIVIIVVIEGPKTSLFKVSRRLLWRISDPPRRYAVDTTLDVTFRTGFSEVRKNSFENTLTTGVDANVGGKTWGLSASVKEQLKITNETIQTWTAESTVKTSQQFKAGHTYCWWSLVDSIQVERIDTSIKGVITTSTDFVECVISTYQDACPDSDSKLYVELKSLGSDLAHLPLDVSTLQLASTRSITRGAA